MAQANMPTNTPKKEIKAVAKAVKKPTANPGKFITTDLKTVSGTIFRDWIVPGLKQLASSIISNSVDMLLFGEARHNNRGFGYGGYNGSPYTSYGGYYKQAQATPYYASYNGPPVPARTGSVFDYQCVQFPTRVDAEKVLDQMFELIAEYGIASVGDFYQSAGIIPNYNDNKWGWTDIRDARVVSYGNCYIVKLPNPYPINK